MTQYEWDSAIEYVKEQLRKQYANMVHENGYGSKAIPQATIEGLPTLTTYDNWKKWMIESSTDKFNVEDWNDIANGRDYDPNDSKLPWNWRTEEHQRGEHSGSKAYESDPSPKQE